MRGTYSNHWVNCEVQLVQPNHFAKEIIEKCINDESIEYDLEMMVILSGVEKKYLLSMFKFSLEMKVGAANIAKGEKEKIELKGEIKVNRHRTNEVEVIVNGERHIF